VINHESGKNSCDSTMMKRRIKRTGFDDRAVGGGKRQCKKYSTQEELEDLPLGENETQVEKRGGDGSKSVAR